MARTGSVLPRPGGARRGGSGAGGGLAHDRPPDHLQPDQVRWAPEPVRAAAVELRERGGEGSSAAAAGRPSTYKQASNGGCLCAPV